MKRPLRVYLLAAAVPLTLGLLLLLSPRLAKALLFGASSDDEVIWLNLLWTLLAMLPGAALALLAAAWFGDGAEDPDDARSALSFRRPKGLLVLLGFLVGSAAGLGLAGQLSQMPLARLLAPQDPRAVLPPDHQLRILGRHQELILLAASRSTEPQVLDRFFKRAASARTDTEFVLAGKRLLEFLDGQDQELAARAAEALATLADRMGVNAATLADLVSAERRWEPEALAWLKGLAPRLRARFEATQDLRHLKALSWLKDRQQEDLFLRVFSDRARPEALRLTALEGLVMLSETVYLPALARALPDPSPELTLRVLWGLASLARQHDPGAIGAVPDEDLAMALERVASVLPEASLKLTCSVVATLAAFDDARATPHLLAIFDGPHATAICPRVDLQRPGGPPVAFVKDQELRLMVLNALAGVALGNQALRAWLDSGFQRQDLPEHLSTGIRKMREALQEN